MHQVAPMQDLVSKLGSEEIIALAGMIVGVIAILGGITVAVTKVVSSHYRRTKLDEMEATLKLEMIQRGMSPDEIKQVLNARLVSGNGRSLSDRLKSEVAARAQHAEQPAEQGLTSR